VLMLFFLLHVYCLKLDPRTLWDVFKAEVRDVTVKICKQISCEKNYELNKLEKTLQSLQVEQDNENNKVTEENAKSLQDKINVLIGSRFFVS
jgi:hypothetical protein